MTKTGSNMIEIGETIRLQASFYDWNNELYSPETVTISIWDNKKESKIEGQPVVIQSVSEGHYYYDYRIPTDETIDVVEQWTYVFEGVTNDSHLLDRGYFTVTNKIITTDYTTILDIELALQKTIDDTTKPSMQEVVRLIKRKEDFIDQLTNTAWREKTIEHEFKYKREDPIGSWWIYYPLKFSPVREIKKIELRTWGHKWIDYTSNEHVWALDGNVLRVYRFIIAFLRWKSLRITYTYGHSEPSGDIRELCTKMVVVDLLKSDRFSNLMAGGSDAVLSLSIINDEYNKEINRILDRHRKIMLE